VKCFLSVGVAMLALGGTAAMAADIPPAPAYKAPAVAPLYNWTGWYIGVNGGGAFGQDDPVIVRETFNGGPFSAGTWPGSARFGALDPTGGFGGGQFGYNWQAGSWVLGLEADFQGARIRNRQTVTLPYIDPTDSITVSTNDKLDWFGTVRGRLGYAWDRLLVYGTGGFAYGRVQDTLNMSDTFGFLATATTSSTRTGYAVGGGVEYAFGSNWSAKIEYQYINLGSTALSATEFTTFGAPSGFAIASKVKFDYNTIRVGLNYKFDWGAPVIAKY
jgi:outer membrane immunogenic protein